MPNLGMGELLTIVLIGLIVLGPRRLPEVMRNLGKAWRTFQTETKKAQGLLNDALDEETKAELKAFTSDPMAQAPPPAATPQQTAGVVDRPDGTPSPQQPAREPSAEEIDAAATVAPMPERAYEDT